MAQLVVRNIEESVKERLQERARRHGQSMEAEARDILRNAVLADHEDETGLGTRIAARFKGIGVNLDDTIRELREEQIRAPDFD